MLYGGNLNNKNSQSISNQFGSLIRKNIKCTFIYLPIPELPIPQGNGEAICIIVSLYTIEPERISLFNISLFLENV